MPIAKIKQTNKYINKNNKIKFLQQNKNFQLNKIKKLNAYSKNKILTAKIK